MKPDAASLQPGSRSDPIRLPGHQIQITGTTAARTFLFLKPAYLKAAAIPVHTAQYGLF
jgi:hypothetical protein